MPFNLNVTREISKIVTAYEINSFALDLDRGELIIAYDQLDESNASIGVEQVITVDGPDFMDAIARVSEIAGADVYAALKQRMYERITIQIGSKAWSKGFKTLKFHRTKGGPASRWGVLTHSDDKFDYYEIADLAAEIARYSLHNRMW